VIAPTGRRCGLPSTFTTDPIGPRSIDEMLEEVYARADGHRRRRAVRRLAAAVVSVAIGSAAVMSFGGGDDEARVRVVGKPPQAEEPAQAEPAPTEPPAAEASARPADGTSASAKGRAAAKKAEEPKEVDATVRQPEGVPPLPSESRARLETWGDATDGLNDSTPNDWYFDISATTMQFEAETEVVVFTTSYRPPDTSLEATRTARVLQSQFAYEGQTFVVDVEESDNTIGKVRIDDLFDCSECSARFDAPTSTLAVNVPLAKLNEAVTRRGSPLGPGADVMSVTALTIRADSVLPSDPADSTNR
jgi:hypothetical protein